MTALETVAAFIAEDIRGRVPAATRAAARLHAIDAVGAWIAGAHTVEGQALITFRGPAPDLATACAVTRASEIDSIHLASATTPGGIIIPAALVVAALRGETDTAAVTEAIVAGTEAMVRLGAAIGGPGILYRGIWPTYFAAALPRSPRGFTNSMQGRPECAGAGARSRISGGRASQRRDDGALVRDRQCGA
jgi:hypothetical protein